MSAPRTDSDTRAFGTVQPGRPGSVHALGWDDRRRTIDIKFRVRGVLERSHVQAGGAIKWLAVGAGEWATFPAWVRQLVPKALGIPGAL